MTITPITRIKRPWLRAAVAVFLAATAACGLAQDGRLNFEPVTGIVGTSVVASASGLTPGQEYDLVWSSAAASWNVADGEFYGISSEDVSSVLGQLTADASGNATTTFVVPEDYGYVHNVFVEQDGVQAARQGFVVAPSLTISPTSGPPGTPITLTLTGVGYRFWESVWHLSYDGAHSGWLSGITTKGTATAVIPATGPVGLHTLQVLSGTHPVPYLNQQQAPIYNPQVPTVMGALFEVTDGPPASWPTLADQQLSRTPGTQARDTGAALTADYLSGTVGSQLRLAGIGFPAGAPVDLSWSAVRGNRLSGKGWEVVEEPLGSVTTDGSGAFSFTLATPDDLGGAHTITATSGDVSADLEYLITPSILAAPTGPVAPGGDIVITIKGVGWTETANIYTLLLDNGYLGYGCGFNSRGDVTIYLKAPGAIGTHFISLYPAIYQGDLEGPGAPPNTATANATYLQVPMLNWQDHPGEVIPAFHIAFEVR